MEKRSRRRIRDLVAHPASQGLDANENRCARISMMARSANAPLKGRIQKRKTNNLQIITSGLQRTAGPYRCARNGHRSTSVPPANCLALTETRWSSPTPRWPDPIRPSAMVIGGTKFNFHAVNFCIWQELLLSFPCRTRQGRRRFLRDRSQWSCHLLQAALQTRSDESWPRACVHHLVNPSSSRT
jgi:hypothetical protein